MGMWRANPKNSRGVRCCYLVSVAVATCLVLFIKFVRVLNPVDSLVALREGRLRMDSMVTSTTHSFRGSLPSQRLAVIVPAHSGDLYRALASLSKWPTKCSPVTRAHVDLVLYKAEAEDELSYGALRLLENTAGICFANTKIVHGALTKEENVYPQGPSVQFYKMYMDRNVRRHLVEYDVLAIIEWDVLVAHETSFEQLYFSAFQGEPFWVKGSVLAGTNFHETAAVTGMWHVLGHINGNAMYNNTDPAFFEFVEYTSARWEYMYPYDVALWATIADFPYSWPLWQRYSNKFVTTKLMANVGFLDVDNVTVSNAIAGETLFIHGSTTGGGSKKHQGEMTGGMRTSTEARGTIDTQDYICTKACRSYQTSRELESWASDSSVSTVCDPSCIPGSEGYRFDGFMCGAGDPSRHGKSCRTCYTNEKEAAKVERILRKREHSGKMDGKHVIMCDTLRPPAAASCDPKCAMKTDTVCDDTCGTGRYGDYNCNWRDRGSHCRHCFNDLREALLADVVARSRGGRVIMCDSHEPPIMPDGWEHERLDSNKPVRTLNTPVAPLRKQQLSFENMAKEPFRKDNLARGNLCAFVPGYFQFGQETQVSVRSIVHFMPGMRVVVPTHPNHFYAFNNTLGHLTGVKVVKSSNVAVSSLLADRFCGNGTELIYYLSPGEILSRTFTFKDTHSPKGDLLVVYAEVPRVGEENAGQSRATTAILGFHSPSFTYGTDLILPAGINADLRQLLLSGHNAPGSEEATEDDDERAMGLVAAVQGVSVPEVLAALAYSKNSPGVWFLNPPQWVTHHMFKEASIWDIPLVKPRFGCSVDMSLSLAGFDVASVLERSFESFKGGGSCEGGYLDIDLEELKLKGSIEFNDALSIPMPKVKDYNVSVMYSLPFAPSTDEQNFLIASLGTVVERFPGALEVVIVANLNDRITVQALVDPVAKSAPFPIRLVMGGNLDSQPAARLQSYRRMNADVYCKGDFVLHMELTEVLLQPVTYDSLFHFGKPVLPYGRYPDDEEEKLAVCRHILLNDMFRGGKDYRFNIMDTTVLPRDIFPELRRFVVRVVHGDGKFVSLAETVVSPMGGMPEAWSTCLYTGAEGPLLPVPDVEFIGAFLWDKMHDRVHWLATDPRDIRPEDWYVDAATFAWKCRAHHIHVVAQEADPTEMMEAYRSEFAGLDSLEACGDFQVRWGTRYMDA